MKDVCYKITLHSEIIDNELSSNQEEADTQKYAYMPIMQLLP